MNLINLSSRVSVLPLYGSVSKHACLPASENKRVLWSMSCVLAWECQWGGALSTWHTMRSAQAGRTHTYRSGILIEEAAETVCCDMTLERCLDGAFSS